MNIYQTQTTFGGRSFLTRRSARIGSAEQSVETPQEFIQAVQGRWGWFSIDLAADALNSKAINWISESQNSLIQDWTVLIPKNTVAWLNPPYANIRPWAEKCRDLILSGHDATILMLVPASVGTNWYRDCVHKQGRPWFLNKRIKFVGHKDRYPKELMLVEYGQHVKFDTMPVVWDWEADRIY